jgi:hypothetical protein
MGQRSETRVSKGKTITKKKLTGHGQRMQWMLQHGRSTKRPSEEHWEKSFSKRKNNNANRKKKTYLCHRHRAQH